MVLEILNEVWHEITGDLGRFALEVLQFTILAVLVWFVAVGFKDRRGIITARLAKRREQIGTKLDRANSAEGRLAEARSYAQERAASAKAEAKQVRSSGTREAHALEADSSAEAKTEAARVLSRVEESLAAEEREMRAAVREQLVEIVALASREVLSRAVPPVEQRERIERAVLAASEAEVEPSGTPHRTGGRS